MTGLLGVAEAQARLLRLGTALPPETVPIGEASGRYLAAPLLAARSQPAADLSAMDGYAIRFDDMPGPWTLVGESAAGRGLDLAIGRGEAARIFTGAPMPSGADSVLVQEEAAREGTRLVLAGEGPRVVGQNVRAKGSDFEQGARLIDAGARLTAPRIALAVVGGHGAVTVRRKPQVLLLSTGDELVLPGVPAPAPLLPASNAPMLAALLDGRQVEVRDGGIVPDRLDFLVAAFTAAAGEADVIVTTGGVSVGDHDLVRPALEQAGADLNFWRVAMRPGKPLMAGRLGQAIVVGLPGNPVSAFVTAHLFLLPLLRHLAGSADPLPRWRPCALAAPLPAVGERAEFLRARIVEGLAHPLRSRDSAGLAELAQSDALIARPAGASSLAAGELCDVHHLA
jgi:molybdopterin molybdotransferase